MHVEAQDEAEAMNWRRWHAQAVRKEFLENPLTGEPARPIPLEDLVALRPGQAMARLGGGAFALPLRTPTPLDEPPADRGETIQGTSWETYGASPLGDPAPGSPGPGRKPGPKGSDDFLE